MVRIRFLPHGVQRADGAFESIKTELPASAQLNRKRLLRYLAELVYPTIHAIQSERSRGVGLKVDNVYRLMLKHKHFHMIPKEFAIITVCQAPHLVGVWNTDPEGNRKIIDYVDTVKYANDRELISDLVPLLLNSAERVDSVLEYSSDGVYIAQMCNGDVARVRVSWTLNGDSVDLRLPGARPWKTFNNRINDCPGGGSRPCYRWEAFQIKVRHITVGLEGFETTPAARRYAENPSRFTSMQHMCAKTVDHAAGINCFSQGPDSLPGEKANPYLSSKDEAHCWQLDKEGAKGCEPARSFYHCQRPDSKVGFNKQDPRSQSDEPDVDYGENVLPETIKSPTQDDAESTRHREKPSEKYCGKLTAQRVHQAAGIKHFSGRSDSLAGDKDSGAKGREESGSFYYGERPYSESDFSKQPKKDSRPQYHDKALPETLESLTQEDTENSGHREKVSEISLKDHGKLTAVRAQHASGRDDFVQREQAGMSHCQNSAGPSDPRGAVPSAETVGASEAAASVQRQLDLYRERQRAKYTRGD